MNQNQGPYRKGHSYDFAINVLANLVATGLVSIAYIVGRTGWFPEHPWWWLIVVGLVAVAVAGLRFAGKTGKTGMTVAGVIGCTAVTVLAMIGVGTAVQAGWLHWLRWFPEHPWPTACATFMLVSAVTIFAIWHAGRLNLDSFREVARRLAALGLTVLGAAKLVQLDMFSKAWNLVTAHPWLTSLIFLVSILLLSCMHNTRSSARVRARSSAMRRKEQFSRRIRLVS